MDSYIIKKMLKKRGIKIIDIAADLGVTHVSVSTVLHRKRRSKRISAAISDAINLPIEAVFPEYTKSPSSGRNTAVNVGAATTVPEDGDVLQAGM